MKINRQVVYDKYDGHCAYCGSELSSIKDMQIDHIRSKRNFYVGHRRDIPDYAVDDIRNLNPACRTCNNFKTAMDLEEFRRELSQQVSRARKYSINFRMAEKFGQLIATEKPIIFYFEIINENNS